MDGRRNDKMHTKTRKRQPVATGHSAPVDAVDAVDAAEQSATKFVLLWFGVPLLLLITLIIVRALWFAGS